MVEGLHSLVCIGMKAVTSSKSQTVWGFIADKGSLVMRACRQSDSRFKGARHPLPANRGTSHIMLVPAVSTSICSMLLFCLICNWAASGCRGSPQETS